MVLVEPVELGYCIAYTMGSRFREDLVAAGGVHSRLKGSAVVIEEPSRNSVTGSVSDTF